MIIYYHIILYPYAITEPNKAQQPKQVLDFSRISVLSLGVRVYISSIWLPMYGYPGQNRLKRRKKFRTCANLALEPPGPGTYTHI